jgi:hypothetical protein
MWKEAKSGCGQFPGQGQGAVGIWALNFADFIGRKKLCLETDSRAPISYFAGF